MTLLAKSGTPSLSSVLPPQTHVIGSGLKAGEAIAIGDLVYIKSDKKFWLSNGTSDNAAAMADGIALNAAAAGDPVDAYYGVEIRYGAGLTPGARYYVAATAGRLDTAPTTGGIAAVAMAIDDTRILFWGSNQIGPQGVQGEQGEPG